MLSLKPNNPCPFSSKCPYHNSTTEFCRGADSTRSQAFVCDLVTEQGVFTENKFRSKLDTTGKMKVLMENN